MYIVSPYAAFYTRCLSKSNSARFILSIAIIALKSTPCALDSRLESLPVQRVDRQLFS